MRWLSPLTSFTTTPTRVGYTTKEVKGETVKVRVCKRDGCGQEIDR